MKSCQVCPISCLTIGVHPKTRVQLGSNYCQIGSKIVYHNAERNHTGQQDRFFPTALGAGGLELKSERIRAVVTLSSALTARPVRGNDCYHCCQIDLAFVVRDDLGLTQPYSRALIEVAMKSGF
jgi:hypothetical protein